MLTGVDGLKPANSIARCPHATAHRAAARGGLSQGVRPRGAGDPPGEKLLRLLGCRKFELSPKGKMSHPQKGAAVHHP